jgi:hypothetical protein
MASAAPPASDPLAGMSKRAAESCYLQLKIKLYGLFWALRALRIHIIGVADLTVEMGAQYMYGMLASLIRISSQMQLSTGGITTIHLFNFKLVHIPVERHQGPDGLLHCEPIAGEDNNEDDPKEWVDDSRSLGLWLDTWDEQRAHSTRMTKFFRPPRE